MPIFKCYNFVLKGKVERAAGFSLPNISKEITLTVMVYYL